jgi:hypothetical protein
MIQTVSVPRSVRKSAAYALLSAVIALIAFTAGA